MSDGNTGASSVSQAIELIKSARKAEARSMLLQILQENPQNEQAWVALAACAASKSEFERSIQQALKLNPINTQALQLAQQNKIELPAAAKIASKTLKKKAKKRSGGKKRGGSRLRRILLLLLIIFALGAAAIYVLQSQEEDETTASDEVISTEEAEVVSTGEAEIVTTEEPEVVSTEAVEVESTEEPEIVATEQLEVESTEAVAEAATEIPTETPAEVPTELPTEVPTEVPTEEASPESTITPTRRPITSPTEISINTPIPDQGLFTSDSPADYLVSMEVQAGVNEETLRSSDVYEPTDRLNLVVEISDHGDPLSLTAIVQSQNSDASSRNVVNRLLPAGTAQRVIISIQQPVGEWQPGVWTVQFQINNATVQETSFTIAGAEVALPPSPEPESATIDETVEATETLAASPTAEEPAVKPTLRLVFDDESIYLMNISGENIDVSTVRFIQTDLNDTEIAFEVLNWQQGPSTTVGSVYQLQPDSCFRLGVRQGLASSTPPDCIRLSQWRVAAAHNLFWVKRENGADTFAIRLEDQEIAECEIAVGICEFALPENTEQ